MSLEKRLVGNKKVFVESALALYKEDELDDTTIRHILGKYTKENYDTLLYWNMYNMINSLRELDN